MKPLLFAGLLATGFSSLAYVGVDYWRERQQVEYEEKFDQAMDRARAKQHIEEKDERDRIARTSLDALEQMRRDNAIRSLEIAQSNHESNTLLAEMIHKNEQDANEREREREGNMYQLELIALQARQQQQQDRQQRQIEEIQLAQSKAQKAIRNEEGSPHSRTIATQIGPSAPGYNPAYPGMMHQQQYQQQQNQIHEMQQQQQYEQQREMMRNQGWGRPGLDGVN